MLQADRHGKKHSLCVNDMRSFLEGTTYEAFAEWLISSPQLNQVGDFSITELETAVAQYLGSDTQNVATSLLIKTPSTSQTPQTLRNELRQGLDTILGEGTKEQQTPDSVLSSSNLSPIQPQPDASIYQESDKCDLSEVLHFSQAHNLLLPVIQQCAQIGFVFS